MFGKQDRLELSELKRSVTEIQNSLEGIKQAVKKSDKRMTEMRKEYKSGDDQIKKEIKVLTKLVKQMQGNKSNHYYLKRWIEITTKIGCSNNCVYCPQHKLVSTYCTVPNRKMEMSLEDFKRGVKHIPKWLDICFTGMNEPFENKEAFAMLEYAVEKGYKAHVYTTLKTLTMEQIECFRDMNIKTFVIHMPDNAGMMNLHPDEEYIQKLERFDGLDLNNVKYVCIGELHPAIPEHIAEKVDCDKIVQLRAGNVTRNDKMSETLNYHPNCGRVIAPEKRVICNARLRYRSEDREPTHIEKTILLPDGSLILCCMDFGLEHVLGNLYEQTYEKIMYGEVMQEIEKSMLCESNVDILCRRCESAREFDEDYWENFCQGGKYRPSLATDDENFIE